MLPVPSKIIVKSVEMNMADFVLAGGNLSVYLDSVFAQLLPRGTYSRRGLRRDQAVITKE